MYGCTLNVALTSFFLKFKFKLVVKRVFFLNAAFTVAFLDAISCVHHASFVIVLPK